MMKQTFDITGMSCSACQARVEQAASSVSGVEHAVVNLLKNTLDVNYDGSERITAEIIDAVERAGYGASVRDAQGTASAGTSMSGSVSKAGDARRENQAAREAQQVKRRLVVSFCFTIAFRGMRT